MQTSSNSSPVRDAGDEDRRCTARGGKPWGSKESKESDGHGPDGAGEEVEKEVEVDANRGMEVEWQEDEVV